MSSLTNVLYFCTINILQPHVPLLKCTMFYWLEHILYTDLFMVTAAQGGSSPWRYAHNLCILCSMVMNAVGIYMHICIIILLQSDIVLITYKYMTWRFTTLPTESMDFPTLFSTQLSLPSLILLSPKHNSLHIVPNNHVMGFWVVGLSLNFKSGHL